MWSLNPSLPTEKLGVGSSLSVIWLHAGFMVRMCHSLSYPFRLGIFAFTRCVGVAGLGSWSHSLVITSCVTVHSVFPWVEGSSGTSIWVDLPLKASYRLRTLVPWGRYVEKTCGDYVCLGHLTMLYGSLKKVETELFSPHHQNASLFYQSETPFKVDVSVLILNLCKFIILVKHPFDFSVFLYLLIRFQLTSDIVSWSQEKANWKRALHNNVRLC